MIEGEEKQEKRIKTYEGRRRRESERGGVTTGAGAKDLPGEEEGREGE